MPLPAASARHQEQKSGWDAGGANKLDSGGIGGKKIWSQEGAGKGEEKGDAPGRRSGRIAKMGFYSERELQRFQTIGAISA